MLVQTTSSGAHSVSTLTDPQRGASGHGALSVPAALGRGPWEQSEVHGQSWSLLSPDPPSWGLFPCETPLGAKCKLQEKATPKGAKNHDDSGAQARAAGELVSCRGVRGFLAHLLSHSEGGSLSFTSSVTSREWTSGESWSPGSPKARKERKRKKVIETAQIRLGHASPAGLWQETLASSSECLQYGFPLPRPPPAPAPVPR
uniref:Uncharacterized protein n=1 Tax=Myotis myotis TaxID=51298 RepID=A0A7J7V3Q6_MYOMY|nr:hypothetical protein mMyoMyo1_008453 [Myotis myotis]